MKNPFQYQAKQEGSSVDCWEFSEKESIDTTYVERRIPIQLEEKVHKLIDRYLMKCGFDPENI